MEKPQNEDKFIIFTVWQFSHVRQLHYTDEVKIWKHLYIFRWSIVCITVKHNVAIQHFLFHLSLKLKWHGLWDTLQQLQLLQQLQPLPTPVAFWCHLSDSQLSVAGLSASLVPASGICFRTRPRQLSHCRHSASVSRLSSSRSPILMSYSELKHCRLLTFHSRFFRFLFFHFSLYLEVALLL